ncbi:glycosyltransferase N-terminal domain-containing protein [soil metagenome]
MGLYFYILFTRLYFFIIKAISPVNGKARLFIKGRKKLFERIENELKRKKGELVWFHCASLGEFEQGRPVMEAFKRTYPQFQIFLTFFSPSGYEIRKNYAQADFIFYLPEDTANNAKKLLSLINPSLVIFIKYEYWHFHIREINKLKIPLILISAIFRSEQLFFKSYGKFYRNMLKNFNHIFVQNQQSLELLKKIGLLNVTAAGDTRFDRVKEITENVQPIPLVAQFSAGSKIMVAGSTWKEDLQVLAPLGQAFPEIKFIIAPHEISESSLAEVEQFFSGSFRYSKGMKKDCQVMIIDNIGMLSSLYQYGDYAYIGGAFGKGLHNILEAATFGMPVLFGNKNYKKFAEALQLMNAGAAFAVGTSHELAGYINELDKNPSKKKEVGRISKKFVEENTGATDIIIQHCKGLLSHKNGR